MGKLQEFRTSDFSQAVVCRTIGLPLLRTERNKDKYLEFVFSDPDFIAEDSIEKYWNCEIKADIKVVLSVVRELKTRIHSEMRKDA